MPRLSRSRASYVAVATLYALVVYATISFLFTAELVRGGLLEPAEPLELLAHTATLHLPSLVATLAFFLIAAWVAYRFASSISAQLTVEERRAAELSIVSNLATRIAGEMDEMAIARESLVAVRETCSQGTTASFVGFDELASTFRVSLELGPDVGVIRGNTHPIGTLPEAIRHQVFVDRRMLVMPDTQQEGPAWTTFAARFPAIASARTFALVPLLSGNRLLGALMLRDDRPNAITASRLDLIALLVHTIAAALHGAHSLRAAHARAEREAIVNRVAQAARSSLDPAVILQRTVNELGPAMNVSYVTAALGARPDDLRVANEWTAPGVTGLGVGSQRLRISRVAAREQKAIVIGDLATDGSYTPEERSEMLQVARAVLAYPIISAGQLVGTLTVVDFAEPHAWSPNDLNLVQTLAHELRGAMETARQFQARQRENDRMLALHHASAILAGQTDPSEILEQIIKSASKLMAAGGGALYIWVPEAKILRLVREQGATMAPWHRTLHSGEGLAGRAFARAAPAIFNDYETWRDPLPTPMVPNLHASLAVPLIRGGGPIGAIVIRAATREVRFTDEDGHLLTLFADQAVSALSAAEAFEQQRAAVHELERLSKAKSDFISIVSHEFRTPLTGIQGFSEMMRDEDLSPKEMREYASDINKDSQRLNRMINDMLDLDRMESGKMTLRLEQVGLNDIIREVSSRLGPNAPDHRIALRLDERIPDLAGDRDKLTQVVTNLLNNAVKYSPDGGAITIKSRQDGSFAIVSVEDHGMGIAPENLDKVFERYSRVESKATRHIQGTGLGLPIVRQILEMHGGDAWVESTNGVGSTFSFRVPLAGAP